MITSRSTFDYQGQVLIEKMRIRAPFLYEAIFQNTGCFIYFKQRGPQVISSATRAQMKGNEAVLLKCGNHFLDLLRDTDDDQVEVIAIHLYPDLSANTTHIREVIELHLFSNLKLEQLAKISNLSLSSFKREFKKEFNDSPTNYINNKRLEKAKELLTVSDLPISEIAYEIGFQDSLYFTRLFKKKIGLPPTAYRTKHGTAI